jgi:7-keto-8-aminopelargonate synthetase-like enzyme
MNDNHQPPVMESPPGPETVIDGRRYLYFGGTSYLGLAGRPEVIEAACEAARRFGLHTATSRSGLGNNPATLAVERQAAEFFGKEDAFFYASGYAGNHVLVQALAERFDAIIVDESSHYCVHEAARLAGGPVARFRHLDPEDLRQQIHKHLSAGQHPLVMTDGVFSMTGAVAPIDQYIRVLSEFDMAALLIDDAHGVGAIGECGRGTVEYWGLWGPRVNGGSLASGCAVYVAGTLSKALGGFGGILPGSRGFLGIVRSASHYFDGASAPAAPVAGASAKALEIVRQEPQLRERLRDNAWRLRAAIRALGVPVADWPTPIIGLTIGDAENMRRIHRELKAAGILLPYFASYAGAGKDGLLRIAVFATHTPEMIDQLVGGLGRLL